MKYTSGITILIIILPLIVLMVLLMSPVDIQAAVNTTIIEVNISEQAQISVLPTSISWTQIAPGANGSVQTIIVKNIGSTTFSNGIYVSVDSFANTTTNPTTGASPKNYMAGSFLVIRNSTHSDGNGEYWFVNQISWNESTYPEPSNPTSGAVSWGYYHNKTSSWLWELNKSNDGTCSNVSDAGLKIIPTESSETNGKDISGATAANPVSNTTEWGLWNVSSGPLADYCIASSSDCTRLMLYKFDLNSSLPNACPDEDYIAGGSLAPNVEKNFYVKPHVPRGVPSGTVTNSTVTFTAS